MFDIQILVNGNRCKQYNYQGRTFIEAKHDSEYELEIKNTYYKRILAVCSVDGLDVLTGKPAELDAGGYILDAYHPIRIKGFRVNDDEVGAFKFTCKQKSYAASKGDGSERNCGVIGVRLYYEIEPVVAYTIQPANLNYNQPKYDPYNPFTTTCGPIPNYAMSSSYSCNSNFNYHTDVQWGCCSVGSSGLVDSQPIMDYCCNSYEPPKSMTSTNSNLLKEAIRDAKAVKATALSNEKLAMDIVHGFDMGTDWGKRKESKVYTTDFKRGCLALSQDIYYASREALVEMGVPITNELKVNLPQSFPGKYAVPPKGWNG